MMIIVAFIQIGMGKISSPSIANFQSVPNLFGVIIYAFMCQHSIPGMVTPLNNKKGVNILLFVDYFSILCYYATLSFSAVFRLVKTATNINLLQTMLPVIRTYYVPVKYR